MKYSKKNKLRKSKKFKGGQRVNYSMQSVWHNIHQTIGMHNRDCGPSVCKLLGYCDEETAIYMAQKYQDGITGQRMLTMINRAYPNNNIWIHISGTTRESLLADLNTYIGVNQATIAAIGTDYDEKGHFFAIYNDGNGLFLALDPQNGIIDRIGKYLTDRDSWDTLYIMASDTVIGAKEWNRLTQEIIDTE